MSRIFVTSFSKEGYISYGKTFIEGFVEKFPKKEHLHVFLEDMSNISPTTNTTQITYHNLLEDRDLTLFLERNTPIAARNGIFQQGDGKFFTNYRYMATKFVRKVAALTSPFLPLADWRVWIDADVVVTKPIPETFFDDHFTDKNVLVYYIGRDVSWDHSECGFVAYNTFHREVQEFLRAFRGMYMTDRIFTDCAEWHDSWVFDVLRTDMMEALQELPEKNNLRFVNIAEGIDIQHPWPKTILGEYMNHLKGPARKHLPPVEAEKLYQNAIGTTPEQAKQLLAPEAKPLDIIHLLKDCKDRYEQLLRVISVFKPQSILEVGTFDGGRAIQMATEALKYKKSVHYIGYDLFEQATKQLNEQELNVKGSVDHAKVTDLLSKFQSQNPGFTFELVRGNTRETLKEFGKHVDFVFLDGGHSVETIQSDYNNLKDWAKMIILDDYYIEGVDTTKFGCNTIIAQVPHLVLPVNDTFSNGQKIAMVMTGPVVTQNKNSGPIQLKTKNAAPDEAIQSNIRYASQFQKDKLEAKREFFNRIKPITFLTTATKPHDQVVVFLGAGDALMNEDHPDYTTFWDEIKEHALNPNVRLISSKTINKKLYTMGIKPWGTILLDPRDHVASFLEVDQDIIYFVASMCHPTTYEKLLNGNAKIVGYHAMVGAGEPPVILQEYGDGLIIAGGTTSVTRGIHLFYMLGFRNVVVYGVDGSYWKKPEKTHGRSPKPFVDVEVHGRKFLTDPEFVAESQDFEHIVKMFPDINLTVKGDGMIQHALTVIREAETTKAGDIGFTDARLGAWIQAFKSKNELLESINIDKALAALDARKKYLQSAFESLKHYEESIGVFE